jgi:membrane-associated phospholipid phosphatase
MTMLKRAMGVSMLSLIAIVCFSQQDTIPVVKPDSIGTVQVYQRPKSWGFITHVPDDLWQIAKSPFKKENLQGVVAVALSTAILIPLDQPLLDGVKNFSTNIHLHAETDYHVLVRSGNTKILKIPKNFNTALYQVGEGGTSMMLAGGLFIYGKLNKDYRALQTASDITETFITMGITTQLLKRSFGRQSPFMSTQRGGAWHPFPSLHDYQTNTSNYDAFPSGHLATMMATVTVLAFNYPEKKWIKPVGYSLIGLSGWAMMNTDVHWISDYPLALALGYISAKITCLRHKKAPIKKIVY